MHTILVPCFCVDFMSDVSSCWFQFMYVLGSKFQHSRTQHRNGLVPWLFKRKRKTEVVSVLNNFAIFNNKKENAFKKIIKRRIRQDCLSNACMSTMSIRINTLSIESLRCTKIISKSDEVRLNSFYYPDYWLIVPVGTYTRIVWIAFVMYQFHFLLYENILRYRKSWSLYTHIHTVCCVACQCSRSIGLMLSVTQKCYRLYFS